MKHYHKNPRQITTKQFKDLRAWLAELGDLSGIVHDLNSDEIIGGNMRLEAMGLMNAKPVIVERFNPPTAQGTVAVGYFQHSGEQYVYRAVRWSPEQCEKANIVANKAGGDWDIDILADQWELSDLLEWGFEESELQLDWGSNETEDDLEAEWANYVPDALFPSDNEWGIPTLDIALQADFVELPFTRWGEIARTSKMPGTYHFYTDDYKFEALWADPLNLINSQCAVIVEPNISTNEQMPRAVGLWSVYRKRWLARYCQNYGIKVFVDLSVAGKFGDLNLLGVPTGWKAYATRALDRHLPLVISDYEMAQEHAGRAPLFLTYGGGHEAEAYCQSQGWIWIPENMHVKDGRRDG